MDINKIEKELIELDNYPLDEWNPPLCEGVEFTLDEDSKWFYNGSEIKRKAMIKLFSKLVKREGDNYFVVTPSEKICLKAKGEIFSIIDYKKEDENSDLYNQIIKKVSTTLAFWFFNQASTPEEFNKIIEDVEKGEL